MTINAATSPYNGNWIMEDGMLNMDYGGDFAGPITIRGGRLNFTKDYTVSQLTIELNEAKKDAYVGGLHHLSGGSFCISIDTVLPDGVYMLAEGAEGFNKAILVQNSDGTPLGAFVVGQSTTINNANYTLKLDGGTLVLSVSRGKSPVQMTTDSKG